MEEKFQATVKGVRDGLFKFYIDEALCKNGAPPEVFRCKVFGKEDVMNEVTYQELEAFPPRFRTLIGYSVLAILSDPLPAVETMKVLHISRYIVNGEEVKHLEAYLEYLSKPYKFRMEFHEGKLSIVTLSSLT